MKQQFVRAIAFLGLVAAVSAGPVLAQTLPHTVVNVPFDFIAGNKKLPAGEYTIKRIKDDSDQVSLVQSRDGRESSIAITSPVGGYSGPAESKVIFHKYGNQYFLSQVWTLGESRGRELPISDRERSLRREMATDSNAGNTNPQTVTVVGS
jgi:hypothetical protein